MPFTDQKKLLRTVDLAEMFSVTQRTVYNWMQTGTIAPAGRMGRQWYFDPEDVKKALKKK